MQDRKTVEPFVSLLILLASEKERSAVALVEGSTSNSIHTLITLDISGRADAKAEVNWITNAFASVKKNARQIFLNPQGCIIVVLKEIRDRKSANPS